VIGDAHCAPYEGGPLERGLWWLIGRAGGKRRFTDDTQMAFDLGRHLVRNGDIVSQALASEFADGYRWSRGYGPSTVAVLRQIKKGKPWQEAGTHRFKDGSFGNGAAMRIAPLAVFLHQRVALDHYPEWVAKSAEVTHPNQRAIDGAMAVALCLTGALEDLDPVANLQGICPAMNSPELKASMERVGNWVADGCALSAKEAKAAIGAGTAASESCPIAIYIGLKGAHGPLCSVLEASIIGGGDTDTIGAMAGAIWGAYNGFNAITGNLLSFTEGVEKMDELIHDLRQVQPKGHSV
jgi:ADP-ribosylglycohydrolase